jgi:phage shock protein A
MLITKAKALELLSKHEDHAVRGLAKILIQKEFDTKKNLQQVQDTLSQMRVDLKYLAFDLHCTRQERDELRERLNG